MKMNVGRREWTAYEKKVLAQAGFQLQSEYGYCSRAVRKDWLLLLPTCHSSNRGLVYIYRDHKCVDNAPNIVSAVMEVTRLTSKEEGVKV